MNVVEVSKIQSAQLGNRQLRQIWGGSTLIWDRYINAVLATPGVVGFWPMQERSGKIAQDFVGNNPAHLVGADIELGGISPESPGGSGPYGRSGAAHFLATNPAVSPYQIHIPYAEELAPIPAATIEAWISMRVTTVSLVLLRLAVAGTGMRAPYQIAMLTGGRLTQFDVGNGTTTVSRVTGGFWESPWYHHAWSYDGPTRANMREYINGIEVATTPAGASQAPGLARATGQPIEIGQSFPAGAGLAFFAIYNRVLAVSELKAHFDAMTVGAIVPMIISGGTPFSEAGSVLDAGFASTTSFDDDIDAGGA